MTIIHAILVPMGIMKLSWIYQDRIFPYNGTGIVAKSADMFREKVLETR